MKIKAIWGFHGDPVKLGAESSRVVRGQVFDKADEEYGHILVGKGLVEEVGASEGKPSAPKTTKPAKPDENKGGKTDKADADAGAKKDGEGA